VYAPSKIDATAAESDLEEDEDEDNDKDEESHEGAQFKSTPMPQRVLSPSYCLAKGVVQPPKELKSLKLGLES